MRIPRFLAVVMLVLLAACGSQPEASYTRLGPTQFAAATADPEAVLIDLRTAEEYRVGHISGSRTLDYYDDFADQLADLDTSVHYLIYCDTGARSANALRTMKELGFRHVTELDGGIQAWNAADLPLVTP